MQVIPSDSARLRHERQSSSDKPPSQTAAGTISSVPMLQPGKSLLWCLCPGVLRSIPWTDDYNATCFKSGWYVKHHCFMTYPKHIRSHLCFRQSHASAASPGIRRKKRFYFRHFHSLPLLPSTPVEQPHMINYPNTTVDHCCFDKPLVLMSCQAAKLFDDLLLPKCRIQIPKIAYLPPRWLPPAKSEKRHFFWTFYGFRMGLK